MMDNHRSRLALASLGILERLLLLTISCVPAADALVLGRSQVEPKTAVLPNQAAVVSQDQGQTWRLCRAYARPCIEYAVNDTTDWVKKSVAVRLQKNPGEKHAGTEAAATRAAASSSASKKIENSTSSSGNVTSIVDPEELHKLHVEETTYGGGYNQSQDAPRMNLCINGRLVPRFFLLGVQKAATTNFFNVLMDAGMEYVAAVNNADPNWFWKEPHVFDWDARYYGLGRDGWLSYYPLCSHDTHAIGVDATPSYASSPVAPARIQTWYGPLLAPRLEFLVILREPLSRMHSSFYHGKQWAFQGLTFGSYVGRALANTRLGCASGRLFASQADIAQCDNPDDMPLGDPYYLSLYVPQLTRWFATYNPAQFVVAPMLAWVAPAPGQPSLLEYMNSRLGGSIKAGASTSARPKMHSEAGRIGHANPDLETDLQSLSVEVWEGLKAVMNMHASPLALGQLMAPYLSQGLTVFGYKANPALAATVQEQGIAAWIGANW